MYRVLALVLAVAVPVSAQTLTERDAEALIMLGRANALGGLDLECDATAMSGAFGWGGLAGAALQAVVNRNRIYDVTLMTHRGRVAATAWEATRAGRELSPGDLPEGWQDPALFTVITPRMPDADDAAIFPSKISAVWFKARLPARDLVVEPTEPFSVEAQTWRNTMGATVDYERIHARFDLARVSQLARADEIEFTVETEAGDRRCILRPSTLSDLLRATK